MINRESNTTISPANYADYRRYLKVQGKICIICGTNTKKPQKSFDF